jgi:uncharacterized RDD family membrane protein YckC
MPRSKTAARAATSARPAKIPPTAANPEAPAGRPVAVDLSASPVIPTMKRRLAAYFLDSLLLLFVVIVFVAMLAWVGLWVSRNPDSAHPEVFEYNYPIAFLDMALGIVVSGLYFATAWTVRGATLGQEACQLRVVDAADGLPLRRSQSWRRWLALGLPLFPVMLLMPIPAIYSVLSVVILIWGLVLLVTTASQKMRRGLHDRYVGSVVVRVPNAGKADQPAG